MPPDNVPPVLHADRARLSRGTGRFSIPARCFLIGGGLFLLSLLLVASRLKPDERGFGTHQQLLWMAPCGFKDWARLPCPTCGMTTSWAHLVRGDLWSAFRANSMGAVLGVLATFVGPWAVMSGIGGRWLVAAPSTMWVLSVLIGIGALGLVQWTARIAGVL